jgi:diguanylate cyclase (GGDEF)-like protein
LPEIGLDGAIHYAEKIRSIIEAHNFGPVEQHATSHITVSMGISVYPLDGTDATQLIHRADEALYLAKRSGKNKVCHEPARDRVANGG